jgi:hypothetical protein
LREGVVRQLGCFALTIISKKEKRDVFKAHSKLYSQCLDAIDAETCYEKGLRIARPSIYIANF